jgi:hypothetical protein
MKTAIEPGASTALDLAAAADEGCHIFLRAAWFAAAAATRRSRRWWDATRSPANRCSDPADPAPARAAVGQGGAGKLLALSQLPHGVGCKRGESRCIARFTSRPRGAGRAWRVGPIYADDPAAARLVAAAQRSGWTVLQRRLGTCFVVDLAR